MDNYRTDTSIHDQLNRLQTASWGISISTTCSQASAGLLWHVCGQRCRQIIESLQGDSPASPSVSPENNRAPTTPDGYGPKPVELLARYDPKSACWKMCRGFLAMMTDDCLDQFSETWPRSGMTVSGIASRLPTLARRISGTGCGLLPTPNSSDATREPDARDRPNSGGPNLLYAAKMWPTPSARDWKDTPGMALTGTNPDGSERKRDDQLARRVYQANCWNGLQSHGVNVVSGQLNVEWVSMLMGYPPTWTVVDGSVESQELSKDNPTEKTACDASAMPLFPK